MTFTFAAAVAWDSTGNKPVRNASFQAYAISDTGFTTPLVITDPFNNPIPGNILNSGAQGVFPQFNQATNSAVVITDPAHTYAWTINAVMQDASVAAYIADPTSVTAGQLSATYATYANLAKNPDSIIAGTVTVDGNNLVTSAAVVWPDGKPGTMTITSRDANNAVTAYNITYGSPVIKTFTQPTITRNAAGAATNVPQIVVS